MAARARVYGVEPLCVRGYRSRGKGPPIGSPARIYSFGGGVVYVTVAQAAFTPSGGTVAAAPLSRSNACAGPRTKLLSRARETVLTKSSRRRHTPGPLPYVFPGSPYPSAGVEDLFDDTGVGHVENVFFKQLHVGTANILRGISPTLLFANT